MDVDFRKKYSGAIAGGMPADALEAAVKVIVGGGINEPLDAMGIATLSPLNDDAIRTRVLKTILVEARV